MDAIRLAFLGQPSPVPLILPIMATRICAGFPSPADDHLDEDIDLAGILIQNKPATFMWRVLGNSVVEAGIHDGDVVVVDRSVAPTDGCVVVAAIDGEVSLKVYRARYGGVLTFANPDMPIFALGEMASVEIWGVVIWTLHRPRMP